MTFSIAGKTAIVTGAANGVGAAIARHFIEHGAQVMLADKDEDALSHQLGKTEAEETAARIFAGDLRQRLTIANLLSATIDAFDRVDILVNASRQMKTADPLDTKDDTVDLLLDQNLKTSLNLSRAVAARMIQQAEEDGDDDARAVGSIVNLSSIAARRTHPGLLAYSVATAALDQMTRTLAVALAPQRVRVNAVAFGSVMSASLREALKEHSEMRDDIADNTPLGRIAGPGEVAETVHFLASEASNFVTGQIITVDGGRTLIDPVGAPAH